MRTLCSTVPLLLAAACATPTEQKMSFEEAFQRPPPPAVQRPAGSRRKRVVKNTPEASPSVELRAALAGFGVQARQHRGELPRGSPMPPAEVDNWLGLLDAVDAFLARPARETSSLDVIRARAVLEAELEQDARSYGDIPPDLADGALERIAQLATRMAEVRRLQVRTRDVPPELEWPIQPVAITSLFGRRLHPILKVYRQHMGIDLAAAPGQLVTAVALGTVTHATWSGGHGYSVELSHLHNIVTRYSHLAEVLVEPGALVKKGEAVGVAGSTGRSTGVHLHFELWRDGQPRDPLEELGKPPPAVTPLAALH